MDPPGSLLSPDQLPHRGDLKPKNFPERCFPVTAVKSEVFPLWGRYSSFNRLVRIVAWMRRALRRLRKELTTKDSVLMADELRETRLFLHHLAQQENYPGELEKL